MVLARRISSASASTLSSFRTSNFASPGLGLGPLSFSFSFFPSSNRSSNLLYLPSSSYFTSSRVKHPVNCGCPLCRSRLPRVPILIVNNFSTRRVPIQEVKDPQTQAQPASSAGKSGGTSTTVRNAGNEESAGGVIRTRSENEGEKKMKTKGGGVSQNLYEDQEEEGETEPDERDPNVLMDHVQLARRVPRHPQIRSQNLEGKQSEESVEVRGGRDEGDVIDKPEAGKTDPHGVSYS